MLKKIALIPARSGSKGLVDKNILMLLDKPLIAYTIIAALDSGVFDKVIV
ncbi:acylneuraminate cytidylyltransferase, partial [Escherichia coli]|nr:acylneuraminate cytidylyltransferase [Escherichia coli]